MDNNNIIMVDNTSFTLVNYGESARLDLSYKKIDGHKLKNSSFKHSLFTGAIISNLIVENLDFSRCDFAGTVFVDCEFNNCNFSRSGFRSTQINKSNFYDCDLSLINFSDCNFNEVTFSDTTFFNSRIKDSILTKTNFYRANFESLGLILDQLTECHFEETALGNCTVLLLEFNKVTFKNCKIAAESVGYISGITKENLEELDYLYLGVKQEYLDKSNIINDFLITYQERKWPIAILIHSINFNLSNINVLIAMYFQSINIQMEAGGYIEVDELCFAIDIIIKQFDQSNLGFKHILDSYDLLSSVENYLHGIHGDAKKIAYMKSTLYEFIIEKYYEMSNILNKLNEESLYTITVVYKEKPQILLSELTAKLENILGLPNSTIFREERQGSYIEIYSTLVMGLISIQTLLYLTNKVLIQIHNAQITGNKIITFEKSSTDIIQLQGGKSSSVKMQQTMQNNISTLNEHNLTNDLIHNQKEYGLDNDNIQSITAEEELINAS